MTTTASATSVVSVDGDRLWRSLMDLARVGATPKGGNRRLALSALDGQGRDLVVGWMREAGLAITVDAIGNVFGIRAGRDAARRPVMTGSHLDTQPRGGRYDGILGVVAAVEVLRTLHENGHKTHHDVGAVNWTKCVPASASAPQSPTG